MNKLMMGLVLMLAGEVSAVDIEQQQQIARTAGTMVSLMYRGIEQPTEDQGLALTKVTGKIRKFCCTNDVVNTKHLYSTFIKDIMKDVNTIAVRDSYTAFLIESYTKTSLICLDILFTQHPEFKNNTNDINYIIGAYCDGICTGVSISDSGELCSSALQDNTLKTLFNK